MLRLMDAHEISILYDQCAYNKIEVHMLEKGSPNKTKYKN